MPRRLGVVLALFLSLTTVSVAKAAWVDTEVASATYSSATLAPATGLAATASTCVPALNDSIKLTWSLTPSTWADGYEVARSLVSGGPYVAVALLVGRSTLTYTDGSLGFSTTYHYVVRATKGAWRSVNSAQVARTTRTVLCV